MHTAHFTGGARAQNHVLTMRVAHRIMSKAISGHTQNSNKLFAFALALVPEPAPLQKY